jgi:hypothetical protein
MSTVGVACLPGVRVESSFRRLLIAGDVRVGRALTSSLLLVVDLPTENVDFAIAGDPPGNSSALLRCFVSRIEAVTLFSPMAGTETGTTELDR